MLRKIRITLALIFFALISLLFLDFSGSFHLYFGWIAKIQFIPAVLAHSIAIVIGLVIFTLLFGRIYCSILCSLGIFQDGVSNISGRSGKKGRFGYSRALSWLRYSVLVLYAAALIAGISIAVSLFDPYATYGRMATNLFAPLYRWGNNLLAWFAERADSYAFYSVDVWMKSGISLGIAIATFAIVGFLAWRNGRTYCNTICPVGTVLGLVSRFSIFKVRFNTEKCTNCKACERHCKASCIDSKAMSIDHSRCVTCFNCVKSCKFDAMHYSFPLKTEKVKTSVSGTGDEEGISRRKALSTIALIAAGSALKAQQLQADGGLAVLEDKKIPVRQTPIVPPGSTGAPHLNQHCSACQLCISACPNQVLRPSNRWPSLMQPEMSYERGYCRPECTECSKVCPSGAIKPISVEEKSSISIGNAVWIKDNCIVNRDHVQCNTCEQHCPTGAIMLVARDPDGAGC